MVSAMAATMASVSPSRQVTTNVNTPPTMTAMMARRCHARIRGFADRCARLPRRWPIPGCCGSPPAGPALVATGRPPRLRPAAGGLDLGDHRPPRGPGRLSGRRGPFPGVIPQEAVAGVLEFDL